MKSVGYYLFAIKNQLIIIGLILIFNVLVYINVLPSEEYFLVHLQDLFTEYGVVAVAIASFFENIIGFSVYFPGSIVILTAMALTAGNVKLALITFIFIFFPSTIAHFLNYFFGRFSYKMGNIFSRYKPLKYRSVIFLLATTLWHPHFGSMSSFTLGSQRTPFIKFALHFLPFHLFWNVFWGITMYNLGKFGQTNYSFLSLFYVYLLIWILWDLLKAYLIRKSIILEDDSFFVMLKKYVAYLKKVFV